MKVREMKWMLKIPRNMEIKKAMDLVSQAGYDGAEIQLYDLPKSREWKNNLRELVSAYGLKIALHAPSGDLNLTSANTGIRRESLRQMEESIALASELRACVVTLHPGRLSSQRENPLEKICLMEEIMQKIAALADGYEMEVGIENMERRAKEIFTSLDMLDTLVGTCASERVGITLDFAHLFTVAHSVKLGALAAALKNVHISQCVEGISHYSLCVPGGQISIGRCLSLLKKRGYDGTVVVEAKDNLSKEKAEENLLALKHFFSEGEDR